MNFGTSKGNLKIIFTITFLTFFLFSCQGQDIYKTPKGKKYHLSNCRHVENVSQKIGVEDVATYNLEPCKFCKPPAIRSINRSFSGINKAVGESASVQCKGTTKKGTRCKHPTKLSNGYCFQHNGFK